MSAIEDSSDPIEIAISGTSDRKRSRGEFLTGVLSAICFGMMHNITDLGIDTRTIPASQMFGGLIYWLLQRKLGVISNIFAHSVNNYSFLP